VKDRFLLAPISFAPFFQHDDIGSADHPRGFRKQLGYAGNNLGHRQVPPVFSIISRPAAGRASLLPY